MEFKKLEVFCNLVELKSFTKTAEAVNLAQPTVSEHIRNLEEQLGQKLFNRLGREVEPTPTGKLLYGYIRKILRIKSDALQAVNQFSGTIVGRIMIGSSTIPGTYILPYIIGNFRKEYPSIQATIKISGSKRIAKCVINGDLELGVIGAEWNENSLDLMELFSDELTLIVYPEHHFAKKKSISIEELKGEPFILRELASGTRKIMEQIFAQNNFKLSDLQEVAEIGSTEAVKEAVKAGLGISILSKKAVLEDIKQQKLVSVELENISMKRPCYLIKRKNRELSPVASVFYDYIILKAKQNSISFQP